MNYINNVIYQKIIIILFSYFFIWKDIFTIIKTKKQKNVSLCYSYEIKLK